MTGDGGGFGSGEKIPGGKRLRGNPTSPRTIPGKLIPDYGLCFASFQGQEVKKREYEVRESYIFIVFLNL